MTLTTNYYLPNALLFYKCFITTCEKHHNFFSDWLTSIKLFTCIHMIHISKSVCIMCYIERPESELNTWLFYNWRLIIIYKVKRAQLMKKTKKTKKTLNKTKINSRLVKLICNYWWQGTNFSDFRTKWSVLWIVVIMNSQN